MLNTRVNKIIAINEREKLDGLPIKQSLHRNNITTKLFL